MRYKLISFSITYKKYVLSSIEYFLLIEEKSHFTMN